MLQGEYIYFYFYNENINVIVIRGFVNLFREIKDNNNKNGQMLVSL